MYIISYRYIVVFILLIITGIYTQTLEVKGGDTLILKGVTLLPRIGRVEIGLAGFYIYIAPLDYEGYDELEINNKKVYIAIYKPCDSLLRYLDDYLFRAIPQPIVSIDNNIFTIQLSYMRENISYVISLCDPNINTLCSTTIPSTYISLPTATFPGSLLNTAYDISSKYWSLSPSTCSTIIVKSNITYDDMLQCVDIVTYKSISYTDYVGKVYIHAIQNRQLISRWIFPFVQRYNTISTIITNGQVAVLKNTVFSLYQYVDTFGYLMIIISSTTDSNGYLYNAIPDNNFKSIGDVRNTQYQLWQFRSKTNNTEYKDTYSFSWSSYPSGNQLIIKTSVSIKLSTTITEYNNRLVTIGIYNASSSLLTTNTDKIYDISNPIQFMTYYYGSEPVNLYIFNLWICQAKNTELGVTYSPLSGLYGCSLSSVYIKNNIQLINNGSIIPSSLYTVSFGNTNRYSTYSTMIATLLYPTMITGTVYFHFDVSIEYLKSKRVTTQTMEFYGTSFVPLNITSTYTSELLTTSTIGIITAISIAASIVICSFITTLAILSLLYYGNETFLCTLCVRKVAEDKVNILL